jgi:NADPH:quinone reductase-like Zn-dependent oxidoreductase
VQLLARNVTVIATGTPADADRLTGLGAATVIDYTAGPVTDQVRAIYPEGVDALIDLVSHSADELPLDAVRKGGKVASTLSAADEDVLAAAGLTGSNIRGAAVREVVAPLAEQVAAGILKVTVSAVLALDEATDGLATIAAGKSQGKIVVKVSD